MAKKQFSFVDWNLLSESSDHSSVVVHEKKFPLPRKYKSPKYILVNSGGDLFHESVSDRILRRVWDAMWLYPRHRFLVVTECPDRMRKFMRCWACSRHFGWIEADKDPIRLGDNIHLDTLWERDVCGWQVIARNGINNGYGCGHPDNEERDGKHGLGTCHTFNCPIACELDEEDEECQLDPGDDYYVEPDAENMRLYERPRHAFVDNVWLGVSVENQQMANDRIPTLLCTPASVRFAVLKPMREAIDLENIIIKGGFDAYRDDPLNGLTGDPFAPPGSRYNTWGVMDGMKLDWVVCGGATGKDAVPLRAEWIRSIRDQCVRTRVPLYFEGFGEFNIHGKRTGIKRAGGEVDGREWKQIPKMKQ